MLKSSLSNLAIVVLFSIFFFVLITQRMMTSDNDVPNKIIPLLTFNGSESGAFPIISRISTVVGNNTRNFLREAPSYVNFSIISDSDSSESPAMLTAGPSVLSVAPPKLNIVSRTFGNPSSSKPATLATKVNNNDHIQFLVIEVSKNDKSLPVSAAPKSKDILHADKPKTLIDSLAKVVSRTTAKKEPEFVMEVPAVKPRPSTKKMSSNEKDRIHFLDSPKSKPKASGPLEFLNDISSSTPPHPYISPRFGSDISPEKQSSLIQCHNQTRCIVPELQLQKKYKIYFCSHASSGGVRFYYISKEGFLLHPNVEMLPQSRMYQADYVVYLPGSAAWHKSECNDTTLAKKLIVLDEFDGHTLIAPTVGNSSEYARLYGSVAAPWYYMYFKRSFVRRSDGRFEGYPHLKQINTYPMTYAVAEIYVRHMFKEKGRETDLWCTLRGSEHMRTRLRVQQWVAEYAKTRPMGKVITENVNTDQRTKISVQYFESMYDAQFLVTVNPMMWEGDFRLWEAMGTGALIFVDPVFVPHPFPLISGEHVIYFSNTNKTELFEKLDYYRQHKEEARRIAINGYLHAMKYHRTVNLVDYILRSTHLKEAMESKQKLPQYSYTGQYLNKMAKSQLDVIKECQYPGIYDDPIAKPHRNSSAMSLAAARAHEAKLKCHGIQKLNTNIQFLTRR